MLPLPSLVKLGLILAIIATTVGAAKWYNDGLIDQGRAEVQLEWAAKSEEQRKAFEKERKTLEGAVVGLAKSYHAEKAKRAAAEEARDEEREDAIRNSTVAAVVCFDERLRGDWDRDSGHGGPTTPGEAGRSMAPAVR